jgi:hypothetical protein
MFRRVLLVVVLGLGFAAVITTPAPTMCIPRLLLSCYAPYSYYYGPGYYYGGLRFYGGYRYYYWGGHGARYYRRWIPRWSPLISG